MKKCLKFGLVALVLIGCGNYVKNHGGSENLVRFDVEPVAVKCSIKCKR